MLEMLTFAGNHPILAFLLAGIVLQTIAVVIGRGFRVLMVTARGWPPSHLDADGDWKSDEALR